MMDILRRRFARGLFLKFWAVVLLIGISSVSIVGQTYEVDGEISVSSVGSEVSVTSLSDLSLARSGQPQFEGYGDLDFANGNVQLSAKDLSLSDIGGPELSISRSYSSQFYNSTANPSVTADARWGGWIGSGWNLNIAMRAIVVRVVGTENRVIIQTGSISEEYFTGSNGRSNNPRNFAIASIQGDGTCVLRQPGGVTYFFTRLQFQDKFVYQKESPPGGYGISVLSKADLSAYYLTKIVDLHGNYIEIEYDSITESQITTMNSRLNSWEASRPLESIVGEEVYKLIEQDQSLVSWKTRSLTSNNLRPSRVKDRLGRQISMEYSVNSPYQITRISGPNANGGASSVSYLYNSFDNLIEVQIGSLESTKYSYSDFINKFHLYFVPGRLIGTKCFEMYTVDMEGLGYAASPKNVLIPDSESKFDRFRGKVLSRVESSLGTRVEYEYDQSFSTTKVLDHKIQKQKNYYTAGFITFTIEGVLYYGINPAGSGPFVVKKRIVSGDQVDEYLLQYPYQTTARRKTPYLSNGRPAFSFSSVTVIQPKGQPTRYFQFEQGLPILDRSGQNEVQTTWDFQLLRQIKSTQRKDNIIQIETEVLEWDQYSNPIRTITRKGAADWLVQEVQYSQDPLHISNQLIGLPVKMVKYPATDPSQKRIEGRKYGPVAK